MLMKLISNHKWWWSILIALTALVSIITTSTELTITGVAGSMAGHIIFSVTVAAIPWLVYYFIGRELTTEQMMSTITVAWIALAAANLLV
jgi:hypothetical protein